MGFGVSVWLPLPVPGRLLGGGVSTFNISTPLKGESDVEAAEAGEDLPLEDESDVEVSEVVDDLPEDRVVAVLSVES